MSVLSMGWFKRLAAGRCVSRASPPARRKFMVLVLDEDETPMGKGSLVVTENSLALVTRTDPQIERRWKMSDVKRYGYDKRRFSVSFKHHRSRSVSGSSGAAVDAAGPRAGGEGDSPTGSSATAARAEGQAQPGDPAIWVFSCSKAQQLFTLVDHWTTKKGKGSPRSRTSIGVASNTIQRVSKSQYDGVTIGSTIESGRTTKGYQKVVLEDPNGNGTRAPGATATTAAAPSPPPLTTRVGSRQEACL